MKKSNQDTAQSNREVTFEEYENLILQREIDIERDIYLENKKLNDPNGFFMDEMTASISKLLANEVDGEILKSLLNNDNTIDVTSVIYNPEQQSFNVDVHITPVIQYMPIKISIEST